MRCNVGAGNVGAATGRWCAALELGDNVLLDIPQTGSTPQGKTFDWAPGRRDRYGPFPEKRCHGARSP